MVYHTESRTEDFQLAEVKDIKDLVREYVGRMSSSQADYHRKWPMIAGPALRRCTSFAKMDGRCICIYANGSSARAMAMLEKARLISDFNRAFPSAEADDLMILRWN